VCVAGLIHSEQRARTAATHNTAPYIAQPHHKDKEKKKQAAIIFVHTTLIYYPGCKEEDDDVIVAKNIESQPALRGKLSRRRLAVVSIGLPHYHYKQYHAGHYKKLKNLKCREKLFKSPKKFTIYIYDATLLSFL